ncbi:MAG: PorT family protein [Prevotellaceae bacterium]|jgi:hypothetical protein|nr:PorT family protein [Prevotellaceae bacterium]
MCKPLCIGFSFILFLLLSTDVAAQHYVGMKGAQGVASISALPNFRQKKLYTFSPGIFYRYEHFKYAAIQIEANYVNKGYIRDIDTVMITPETAERITSFELPLMAQGFIRMGIFRPYLTGGVTFGYILNRTTQIKGESRHEYVYDEYDRRFEYGIAGGGGTGIKISKFELQLEARYIYHFSFLRNPVIVNRRNNYLNSTQFMFSASLMYRLF